MPKKIERREFLKFLLASGALLTGASSSGALFSGCAKSEEVSVGATYNFLDHLDEAIISAPQKEYVKASSFVINGETRKVLFEHPDSVVSFKDVPILKDGRLTFGVGINEAAWDKGGDGVLFEVMVSDENREERTIYSCYIDPKSNPDERRWLDNELDLSAFAGKNLTFTFRTSAGPEGNNTADWAGWSEPKLRGQRVVAKPKKQRRPNIILISIDTLRSDHLGCYGHQWDISPNIDKLATRGVLFRNALAQSPWTLPSHMSILTSLYPSVHMANSKENNRLSEERVCLAEILKKAGYRTAAFVDGGWLNHKFGYSQGFDIYDDQAGRIATINKKAIQFIEDHFEEEFFLFMHVYDVHGPYKSPSPYNEMYYDGNKEDPHNHSMDFIQEIGFNRNYLKLAGITDINYVRSSYAGGVTYVDNELGKLFAALEAVKSFDNTLVIFLSDHGESLFEHHVYIGHGIFLYDTEVKIPLIIKPPKKQYKNRQIREQVESIDVMPTILELLGLPEGKEAQGKSLVKLMKDQKAARKDSRAFGESSNTGFTAFVRTNKWKYISPMKREMKELIQGLEPSDKVDLSKYIIEGEQLYDLENDPGETRNRAEKEKSVVAGLRKELHVWEEENKRIAQQLRSSEEDISSDRKKVRLTEAEKEQLRALGYAQ